MRCRSSPGRNLPSTPPNRALHHPQHPAQAPWTSDLNHTTGQSRRSGFAPGTSRSKRDLSDCVSGRQSPPSPPWPEQRPARLHTHPHPPRPRSPSDLRANRYVRLGAALTGPWLRGMGAKRVKVVPVLDADPKPRALGSASNRPAPLGTQCLRSERGARHKASERRERWRSGSGSWVRWRSPHDGPRKRRPGAEKYFDRGAEIWRVVRQDYEPGVCRVARPEARGKCARFCFRMRCGSPDCAIAPMCSVPTNSPLCTDGHCAGLTGACQRHIQR